MLVDLGRNDLGRVCEFGTVEVENFMAVENYSHVMHIVSSVVGRMREGVGALDALRSVLPAGTLSGAPKVRAMQIIDGSSRSNEAATAARSATPATRVTSTPASTSAPRWSRTGSRTCRRAAAPWPTPGLSTYTRSRGPRPAAFWPGSSSPLTQPEWP